MRCLLMKGFIWGPGECVIQSHEIFKLITVDLYIIVFEQYLCFDQTLAHGSSQRYYNPRLTQWIPRLRQRLALTANLRLAAHAPR